MKLGTASRSTPVDRCAFAGVEIALQLDDPVLHHRDRRTDRLGGDDAVDADIGTALLGREQDFVEPLAGADAGKDDIDVAPRLKPAQSDHAFGEIDDFDGLSHIEHIDRRVRARRAERMACRRDHQITGFADGHEIAHHVRMGDGNRSAGLDLRLEFRHDRPVGREHVAEAHGDHAHRWLAAVAVAGIGRRVQRLAIHFGKALGGAQHGNRVDRLVGRDHHHGIGAGIERGIGDIDRTEDIGLDAFVPIAFQKRHVLERGGMKNQVRLEPGDQSEHPLTVADVGDSALNRRRARFDGELFKHGVQSRLGILDDEKPVGMKVDDPVADFGPDRAAAASDHDGLAFDEVLKSPVIDRHARSQQQILDSDRRQPQRLLADAERRHPAGCETEPPRLHQHRFRMQLRRQCARRQYHPANTYVLRSQRGDDFFEIFGAAAHGNAANCGALIGRRRRENADRAHILDCTAFNGAYEHVGLGSVPDQKRGHRIGMLDLLLRARVLEQTVRDPRTAKKKYLQQPIKGDRDFSEEVGPE